MQQLMRPNTQQLIREWLPHRPPMRFIDELRSVNPESAVCISDCRDGKKLAIFKDEAGVVPNAFLIEMIAQAIGTWAGFYRQDNDELSEVGFLLSVRSAELRSEHTPEELLTVYIRKLLQDGNVASFDGKVCSETGEVYAEGKVTVYQPTKAEYERLFNRPAREKDDPKVSSGSDGREETEVRRSRHESSFG